MLKKVILSTLLIGFIAALLIGAVIRTNAKTGDSSESHSEESDNGSGNPQAEIGEIVTLAGTVSEMNDDALTITLTSGESLLIESRAWTYIQDQEFGLANGDTLTLDGFYEGDLFEPTAITNAATGKRIQLRSESGRPVWAGGGQGKSE
ncbi:MAG TPA: hypothetical protein VHP83_13065 [Aggregatilineaceae bacterium]|nr:hypothetical protein [Aggregatilineaceae bacterium]